MGRIGATAASPHYSHSNWGSKPHLRHHSSQQCQILNPVGEARSQTCILMDIMLLPLSHKGSSPQFLKVIFIVIINYWHYPPCYTLYTYSLQLILYLIVCMVKCYFKERTFINPFCFQASLTNRHTNSRGTQSWGIEIKCIVPFRS